MFFFLAITPARRAFKRAVGQANHYLVTLELGLAALREFGVPPNSYFAPMWNPEDAGRSGIRAEKFLIAAAMAWTVDCVDGYFGNLARIRRLVHPALRKNILRNDRSIQGQAEAVASHFHITGEYRVAMLHLLIQWRNNLVHTRAENPLRPHLRKLLDDNAPLIRANHKNLDIGIMLKRFDAAEYPEFKEIASLLKASHDLLELIDGRVIAEMNLRRYLAARVKEYFSSPRRLQRLGNFHSAAPERRYNYVSQVLSEFGLRRSADAPSLPAYAYWCYEELAVCPDPFSSIKRFTRARR